MMGEQVLREPSIDANARERDDDVASPEVLIIRATFLAFQKSMADYCPTFLQRKRALSILKAKLKTLKTLEAKQENSAEEQRLCKELAMSRLDEKCSWLQNEMTLMIEREELTGDEQQLVEREFQMKLNAFEAAEATPPRTRTVSKAAEQLRKQLETLRKSKPIVWPVKLAKEIRAHEARLGALAELECPKVPLPLAEVQKLNAKPKLLQELAQMKAESRGWFADAE